MCEYAAYKHYAITIRVPWESTYVTGVSNKRLVRTQMLGLGIPYIILGEEYMLRSSGLG